MNTPYVLVFPNNFWTKFLILDPCAGLQEFIEAVCFLSVLESSYIPTCDEILEKTCFKSCKETMFIEVLLGMTDIAGKDFSL